MKELRVIIAGGRDFDDFQLLTNRCNEILSEEIKDNSVDGIRIISGTARGADKLGEQFANVAHHEVSRFPADWDKYGKSAGYRRNTEMAKFAVEDKNVGILIAFWNSKSRGTKHMIDLGNKYGLKVMVINYES